jgi:hypothetical protein
MGPYAGVDSPYVHSRVDSNTFTMGNPIPESTLTLYRSRLYPPRQGLWIWPLNSHVLLIYVFYWLCFPCGDVGVVVLTIGQADGGHVVVDCDVTHQLGASPFKSH